MPGNRTKSRYRRFSAVVGGAVTAMAKVLGISTARMAAAELNERLDTSRLLQDSIDIKARYRRGNGRRCFSDCEYGDVCVMLWLPQSQEDSFALKTVLLYYGFWEPPPNAKDAAVFYERVLLPKVCVCCVRWS